MRKQYTFIGIMVCFTLFCIPKSLDAQTKTNFWKPLSEDHKIQSEQWGRASEPAKKLVFQLDIDNLITVLNQAPDRENTTIENGAIINFPNSEGKQESYRVLKASVLHPELQAKYPELLSFVGTRIDKPNQSIRFSISHKGLNAIILDSDEGTLYIDCLTKDRKTYALYSRQDLPASDIAFACETLDEHIAHDNHDETVMSRNANDGQLRRYRIAIGCTEEYANYHINDAGVSGGSDAQKKAAILAVMNDKLSRVVALYERELSMTFEIVPNNENIIFLSSPFLSNFNYGELLSQSQQFITTFIGSTNFDFGHMFTTGGGGVVSGRVCIDATKARGITGTSTPVGTQFEGILMHEIGHQFSASHTWNGNANGCTLGQWASASSYEPGSGSTIMGYAGLCGAQNVQTSRDLYFHQRSLEQMWSFVSAGTGTLCSVNSATGNNSPTVEAGANHTIPIDTPYKLTAVGSDPDFGLVALTYNWEQYDLGPSGVPFTTTAQGPLVRSFPPSESNVRYIPRLEDYVNSVNASTEWEKLVLIERDINFRVTLRDNISTGGQNAVDNMTVSVTNTSGPFRVTSQNALGTEYDGGTAQMVTWNVANTDSGLVNTANVNILLSTDGGLTFDTVLLSNTPNDGSQSVVLPNVEAPNCRIMVEAVGNIFYNINTRDFAIEESLSVDENTLDNSLSIYPNPNNGSFTVNISSLASNEDVEVSMYDIRGRRILSNNYEASSTFNKTINTDVQSGVYLLRVSQNQSVVTRKLVIN